MIVQHYVAHHPTASTSTQWDTRPAAVDLIAVPNTNDQRHQRTTHEPGPCPYYPAHDVREAGFILLKPGHAAAVKIHQGNWHSLDSLNLRPIPMHTHADWQRHVYGHTRYIQLTKAPTIMGTDMAEIPPHWAADTNFQALAAAQGAAHTPSLVDLVSPSPSPTPKTIQTRIAKTNKTPSPARGPLPPHTGTQAHAQPTPTPPPQRGTNLHARPAPTGTQHTRATQVPHAQSQTRRPAP